MTDGASDTQFADAEQHPDEGDEDRRCTEFTPAHGVDASGDSDVFGAAICPHCERANPLTGDPADFREQVVRCMGCTRVMVLDATALVAFATEDES